MRRRKEKEGTGRAMKERNDKVTEKGKGSRRKEKRVQEGTGGGMKEKGG